MKEKVPLVTVYINSLYGFPGPYSAFVYKTIGLGGIVRLLRNREDKTAEFHSAIVYGDKGKTEDMLLMTDNLDLFTAGKVDEYKVCIKNCGNVRVISGQGKYRKFKITEKLGNFEIGQESQGIYFS